MSLAATVMPVAADDSILYRRIQDTQSFMTFRDKAILGPALRNISGAASLSDVTIGFVVESSEEPRIPQLGNGGHHIAVGANTFQRLGLHDVVWGKALYVNGKKKQVVWNETSDYLQLYPYVMGDERGGDMCVEQYQLRGGYSSRTNNVYYGVELGYRALSEYRDRDPRPNNTVADLYARIGGGYQLAGKNVLALTVDVGKYKQTNELAYYNELGSQKEYHLTGLGNDFARFSGISTNTFYKGYNIGTSLNLARTDAKGLAASAGYMYTQRQKILSDLNRLPLNELKTDSMYGMVSCSGKGYGVMVTGCHTSRKGNDNIFGEPTGNVYPQIGTVEQYKGTTTAVKAEGFYTILNTCHWIWNVESQVCYVSLRNKHKSSGNSLDSDDLLFGVKAKVDYIQSRNALSFSARFTRRSNLSLSQNIHDAVNEFLTQNLQHVCSWLSGGESVLGLSFDYTRQVMNNKALTVGTCWQRATYLRGVGSNEVNVWIQLTI